MDDKRFRFSEKERAVLFSLFKKYQDIIDIRQRRYSNSQHKQTALRNCWNTIMETFNANPDTGERSMKQIQKFWLNSKLRNRLPSTDIKLDTNNEKTIKVKLLSDNKVSDSDAAYEALAKSCKDEDDYDDDGDDGAHEIEVANVSDSYEEQYENINESYFPNNGNTITLKVIDNQLNYEIPTPEPSSLVAIPTSSQVTGTLVTASTMEIAKKSAPQVSATGTTTYITYAPIKDTHSQPTENANIQLLKNGGANYVITSPQTSLSHPIQGLQSDPLSAATDEINARQLHANKLDLKQQELELRVLEAKLKCEVQEIEKEKAKEELIQMREIHRMKIKEMELRLRNMERT